MPSAPWASEAIYGVAERFRDDCLIEDGSLFTPGARIWTEPAATEFHASISVYDSSDRTFGEKLQDQLAGISPEAVQFAAEALYVVLLAEDDTSAETKCAHIDKALSGLSNPIDIPADLRSALKKGFARYEQGGLAKRYWWCAFFAPPTSGTAAAASLRRSRAPVAHAPTASCRWAQRSSSAVRTRRRRPTRMTRKSGKHALEMVAAYAERERRLIDCQRDAGHRARLKERVRRVLAGRAHRDGFSTGVRGIVSVGSHARLGAHEACARRRSRATRRATRPPPQGRARVAAVLGAPGPSLQAPEAINRRCVTRPGASVTDLARRHKLSAIGPFNSISRGCSLLRCHVPSRPS